MTKRSPSGRLLASCNLVFAPVLTQGCRQFGPFFDSASVSQKELSFTFSRAMSRIEQVANDLRFRHFRLGCIRELHFRTLRDSSALVLLANEKKFHCERRVVGLRGHVSLLRSVPGCEAEAQRCAPARN